MTSWTFITTGKTVTNQKESTKRQDRLVDLFLIHIEQKQDFKIVQNGKSTRNYKIPVDNHVTM